MKQKTTVSDGLMIASLVCLALSIAVITTGFILIFK